MKIISIFFFLMEDSYTFSNVNGSSIFIDETGIAWPSDRENKFARPSNYQSIQWIDVMNGIVFIFLL